MRDAVVTLIAVALAFMALDDITTDNDTNFILERTMLVVSACWFAAVSWRLVRQGRRTLGGLSLGVAILAAVAQQTIGAGVAPGLWTGYLISVLGLLWFAVLAIALAWWNRAASSTRARASRRRTAP